MKVALVYDRVNKWGGAERVLLAFHQIFPEAELFTSVYNKKKASWANVFKVKTSFLQKFPLASSLHKFYAFLMPLAFESFNFSNYDLVISITSEAAKGVITGTKTKHICYCLTPTRYLWSGYGEYFRNQALNVLGKPFVSYLKFWDKIASSRPDEYISISSEVQKRIKEYYLRDSEIIFPPLTLKENTKVSTKREKDYFLIVSRLEYVSYKKIELAIEACNRLKLNLKIIGTGSGEKKLKKIAGSTIEFLGFVSDENLIDFYQNSKALLFPGLEDFGLVMAEAQYFGTPVIAYGRGGSLDIVKGGITGEFFNEQAVDSLMKVLDNFDYRRYNTRTCKENGERFLYANFKKKILEYLNNKL